MLITGILMFTDRNNGPAPPGVVPVGIFFVVLAIASSLGMNTGAALNPARDLGPRILTAMVGYGSQVFNFRNQYWLWCPILGPIFGMIVAAFCYDALLYKGPDSILNKPCVLLFVYGANIDLYFLYRTEDAERHHLNTCGQRNKLRGAVETV